MHFKAVETQNLYDSFELSSLPRGSLGKTGDVNWGRKLFTGTDTDVTRTTYKPSLFFSREEATRQTVMNIHRMSYRNLELPKVPFRKHDWSVVSRVKYKFRLTYVNKIQILRPEVTNPGCDLGQ